MNEVTSEYYRTQDHIAALSQTRGQPNPEALERLQIRLKELEAEGLRLNNLTKKGTSGSQALGTAQEKLDTEQGLRAIEYGEWGQGDTERLAKQREKQRLREMEDKFPTLSKYEINKKLEDADLYVDPKLRYKGKTVQRPEGLDFLEGWTTEGVGDYFRDLDKQSYYADNFRMEKAQGGIMNLKKKW